MSLKAKLEAVIYAAEEPVTLNQLAALFAADALEWKAAQQAAAAEQTAEMAGVSPDAIENLPLIEVQGTSEQGTEGPREQGTEGPREQGTEEPREQGTEGISEPRTEAPKEADSPALPSQEVVSVGETEAYPSIIVNAGSAAPAEPSSAPPEEPGPPADPETEAKRLARQRDREVKAILKQLLDELIAGSQSDGRGIEIREIAGGYRMATKPECHDAVRLFVKSLKPPLKLSLPALETLAVIAYKQPVTAPEVNEIRGVESAGVLGSLLARKLIATAGRKPVIGRPILYKTTKEFLLRFGLKDVSELPSMEEFEKMAATELEMEPEVVQADKAEDAAEGAEQNAGAEPESNSQSGQEAASAESEHAQAPPTTRQEDQEPAPDAAASAEIATPPPPEASDATEPATPLAHSSESNQIEAIPHAEESEKEG